MIVFVLLLFLLVQSQMPVFALPKDGSALLKMERRTFAHDGRQRTYTLYLPHSHESNKPSPLLFLLHGGGGTGLRMVNFTGFDKVAAQAGLIVVCPDGVERHWTDGREDSGHRAQIENIDDVGFIKHLLNSLSVELNIDKSRVYAAGISNGAMMSYRLGLEQGECFAAIGAVAGALSEPLSRKSWQSRPCPVIIINGSADPLVPYGGGDVRFYRKKMGKVISVPETVTFWARHNRCHTEPQLMDLPLPTNKSGLSVKMASYAKEPGGADVEFYTVEGGGHTWPRDSLMCQYLPVAVIGKACRDLDSTRLIWEFFQKHKLETKE